MRKLIAVAFVLALPVFAEEYSMVEDARVMSTAIREWGKSFGPDVKLNVASEYMGIRSIGVATFSEQLVASGAAIDQINALADNFFVRNEAARKDAALPHSDGDTSVRAFRMTTPGYDAERQHALVLGTPDDGLIYIALLEKVSEEEWRVTWTGQIKPMKSSVPPPQSSAYDGALRVGGDVKAPVVVRRVEPIYPEEARAARISGIVIMEAIIDRNGRVRTVQVLKGLPYGLDDAAVEALRQWQFKPGTLNGETVDVIFNLTLNFKLADE